MILIAFLSWIIGCFVGYFVIAVINKIIGRPRLSGIIVFIACVIFGAHFGLLGYIPKDTIGKLLGAFIIGISVPCGIVIWTEDDVLPV